MPEQNLKPEKKKSRSLLGKAFDTYRNGQALFDRGSEVFDMVLSIKTRVIISIVCTILTILLPIGTVIFMIIWGRI